MNHPTHRWANDGPPEDGNVVCIDCDTKPGHISAAEECDARRDHIHRLNHPTLKGKQ